MRYEVRIGAEAERDLESIFDYIVANDGLARGLRVLEALSQAAGSLAAHPERGSHPRELLELGHAEYRQVFFKPYRVIYEIEGNVVHILLFVDGRRDMLTLVAQRVLGA